MSEPYPKGTHEWGNAIFLFVYLSPSSVFLCTWKKKQCKTKKITAASGSVCQLLPTAQSEVMKVEYWPAKFLFTSFMDGDGVEVSKQAKKERGQYPAILTEQIWSIKDRFMDTAGTPEGVRYMGYWPSVRSRWLDTGQVIFCVFMDRDDVEVHKLAKKEQGQYPTILTEQNWSIKH